MQHSIFNLHLGMGVVERPLPFMLFWGTYLLCYAFRILEYFILRTDQTLVGEAIVHKLMGIVVLFAVTAWRKLTITQIGFVREKVFGNLLKGLAFGCGVFVLAYGVEILIAVSQGSFQSLQLYVSTYAINQNTGYRTEALFFLICIVGNIVNVVMEEGVFRGLFGKLLEQKYTFVVSALVSSCFFGFWHMIGPIRSYLDESMTMGDHFVNNTIVNLLHVVSDSGVDEMMAVRVAIAQSVSFILVLIFFIRRHLKKA